MDLFKIKAPNCRTPESKVKAVDFMIEATPDDLLSSPLQANCRLTSQDGHKIGMFLGYGQSAEQALSNAFAKAFKALVWNNNIE